jgi:uncharacterized protein with von Willebrand factor type A (vWA) domain
LILDCNTSAHHSTFNKQRPQIKGDSWQKASEFTQNKTQQIMSNRMYPLTLKGLEDAMRMLSK